MLLKEGDTEEGYYIRRGATPSLHRQYIVSTSTTTPLSLLSTPFQIIDSKWHFTVSNLITLLERNR